MRYLRISTMRASESCCHGSAFALRKTGIEVKVSCRISKPQYSSPIWSPTATLTRFAWMLPVFGSM